MFRLLKKLKAYEKSESGILGYEIVNEVGQKFIVSKCSLVLLIQSGLVYDCKVVGKERLIDSNGESVQDIDSGYLEDIDDIYYRFLSVHKVIKNLQLVGNDIRLSNLKEYILRSMSLGVY